MNRKIVFSVLGTLIFLFLVVSNGCKSSHKLSQPQTEQIPMKPAPVVIYKTKANFDRLVPIAVAGEPPRLASYPDPTDLKFSDGSYRHPLHLKEGYLLDRKGVGPQTVFLRLTYEAYCAQPPDPSTLLSLIAESDPMEEIWHCHLPYHSDALVDTLNHLITSQLLNRRCSRIK